MMRATLVLPHLTLLEGCCLRKLVLANLTLIAVVAGERVMLADVTPLAGGGIDGEGCWQRGC